MASITLKHTLEPDNGLWRLRVWTSEATGIGGKVFVHQGLPDLPYQERGRTVFTNIASAADMVDYPEDTEGPDFAFFRKSGADLSFRSLAMARDTLGKIVYDASALAESATNLGIDL